MRTKNLSAVFVFFWNKRDGLCSVQLPTIAFIKYHFNDQDVGEGQLFEVVKPAVCSSGWDEIKHEPIICCDPMIKANHAT